MSAASFTGRLLFQAIPNVQPLTTIIIICTLVFGFYFGSTVAVLSIVISNVFLGMGIWTLAQLAAFVSICAFTYFLTPFLKKKPLIILAIYAGLMGYWFGFIISLVQAPFFGIQTFWVYYLQGVPFDTFHAIGNFIFFLILYPVLTPLLKKVKL
ncbi:ECF transporter S component [Vagococcus sp. DIV0080]|uniref:ECF transporter S component n=2 Tax=Candidatus Vagococcus giribetii TaxID=2230876 RepID=A0ABS3HXM0_9ENTE|nr:ECF transporter S component [Vagococcus sp. DIV0080]